jgi:hypothetical protein
LHSWFTVRKTLGDDNTDALAGSSLAVLAERHGVDAVHRFLSARFARSQPIDARAWWYDVWRPTRSRLKSATGLNEETFTAEWRTAMAAKPQ